MWLFKQRRNNKTQTKRKNIMNEFLSVEILSLEFDDSTFIQNEMSKTSDCGDGNPDLDFCDCSDCNCDCSGNCW